jgi:hypothetical protein
MKPGAPIRGEEEGLVVEKSLLRNTWIKYNAVTVLRWIEPM